MGRSAQGRSGGGKRWAFGHAIVAHCLSGEHALAREVLDGDVATRFAALPRDPFWIANVVDYAYAIARLGDREAATLLHGILDPYRGRLATTTVAVWGVVDHALGRPR